MSQEGFAAAPGGAGADWHPRADLVPVIDAAQAYARLLQTTLAVSQAEADLRQAEANLMFQLALAIGGLR